MTWIAGRTREATGEEPAALRGELIDVSHLSLRDLDELDRSTFAQELRRLLDAGDGDIVAGFKSNI